MYADLIAEAEVDALPLAEGSFLKSYIHYAAQCTDAHRAYHLLGGLAVLSQSCPLFYSFPFGTPMYSHIYMLSIGKSTDSRKSQAISIARGILKDAASQSVGEQPGSKESLVDSLRMQPRQLITYGEFGAFLAQTERGYLTPLKTTYTEAWDGSPIGRSLVKRKGSPAETEATNPRLSLLCGSTLDFLERHTEPADWTGGFMSRFLTIYVDRERTWSVPPGANSTRVLVTKMAEALIQTDSALGFMPAPCLGFDADAYAMWDAWYMSLTRRAAQSQANEVAGGIARTHAHALKVALLLAWDAGFGRTGTAPWRLPASVLLPALHIADFHIRSLLRVGSTLAPSKDMRERQTVLAALDYTPRTLGHIVRAAKILKRRAQELVETLLEEGTIHMESATDVSRGVRYRLATPAELEAAYAGQPLRSTPPALKLLPGGLVDAVPTDAAAVAQGPVLLELPDEDPFPTVQAVGNALFTPEQWDD